MLHVNGGLTSMMGVSKLRLEDADLFQSYFSVENVSYARSWLYTLRATRMDSADTADLGYKYHHNAALVGIGYRGRTIYLTNLLGPNRYEVATALCSQLSTILNCPILLKKVDEDLYKYLMKKEGFVDGDMVGNYARELDFEDEMYPEQLIDLEKLFLTDGSVQPRAKQFRRMARKFEKKNKLLNVQTMPLINCKQTISASLRELAGHRNKRFSYIPMIDELCQRWDRSRYSIYLFMDSDRVHGLYISELLRESCAGLYCAISSKRYVGITEWMDQTFFRHLWQKGIKTLLLGGSETSGVHNYVQKLLPETVPYATHLILYTGG